MAGKERAIEVFLHQNHLIIRINIMRPDFEDQISSLLKPSKPSEELFDKIIMRIQKEKLISAKRRIALFSLGIAASLAALIPIFEMLKTNLSQSGFLQYFSLIFSNPGTVLKYWGDFTLSILESVPMLSLAAFLTIILALLEFLKMLAISIFKISAQHNFNKQ